MGLFRFWMHNPPTRNGFKMVMNSDVFFGEDIRKLGMINKRFKRKI